MSSEKRVKAKVSSLIIHDEAGGFRGTGVIQVQTLVNGTLSESKTVPIRTSWYTSRADVEKAASLMAERKEQE